MEEFKLNTNWMRFAYEYYCSWFDKMPNSYSITFKLCRSKHYLGQFSCKMNCNTFKYDYYTISMSQYFAFSEKQAIETLVHEMIHLHLTYIGYPHENHGRMFQNLMNKINREHNLNITFKVYNPTMNESYTNKLFNSIVGVNKADSKTFVFNYGNSISLEEIQRDIRRFTSIRENYSVYAISSKGSNFIAKLPKHRLYSNRVTYNWATKENISEIEKNTIVKIKLF